MINLVTMTGADDATDMNALNDISTVYPFVEWGVLLSKSRAGQPRYPSESWLYQLAVLKQNHPALRLSAHLCGEWSRDFVAGGQMVLNDLPHLLYVFNRIQLNIRPDADTDLDKLGRICRQFSAQFILQITDANSIARIQSLQSLRVDVVGLHDLSGGEGKLPSQWSVPLRPYCGYAGGLGPDNLREQLAVIQTIVSQDANYDKKYFWVDMETKVRTEDKFDLTKVEQCLKIVEEFRG